MPLPCAWVGDPTAEARLALSIDYRRMEASEALSPTARGWLLPLSSARPSSKRGKCCGTGRWGWLLRVWYRFAGLPGLEPESALGWCIAAGCFPFAESLRLLGIPGTFCCLEWTRAFCTPFFAC